MTRPNLVELAQLHGQENLRFFVPLRPLRGMVIPSMNFAVAWTSSSDEDQLIECMVDGQGRYPRIVNNDGYGYKVSLRPVNDQGFECRDYYVSDLESILSDGRGGARMSLLGTDVH